MIHDEYIIKIDFVVRKDTPYRRREFSRRKKVKVDDQELFVVSPEDLILSKLEWAKDSHSEVQLNDVRNLLRDVQGLKPKVSCPLGKEFGPRIPLPRGKQVKDTPAAIERKFRKMLLKRSGAERLKMGCSMHATARALAKAYLSERHPDAPPLELKRLLFLHFYNTDFKPDDKRRIASALSENRRFRNVLDASKRTSRRPLELKNLAIVKSSGEGTVREKAQGYGAKRKTKAKHLR